MGGRGGCVRVVEMRVLLGPDPGPIGEDGLAAAYPWPAAGRWVRGMMATTLDGASAGSDGRSGSISSPADRAVMSEVRRYSDAILVGAGTFRAERYRPQRPEQAIQQRRTELGLRPAPVMVLVSRSLDLPWQEDAFRASVVPPLVVTTESCGAAALDVARRYAQVVVLPGEDLAVTDLMALLEGRGLRRVLCEGGPHLLAEIARAGYLDELDLTLSPLMVGGGQVALGTPNPIPPHFRLTQLITAGDFLFTRYLRAGPGDEPSKGTA